MSLHKRFTIWLFLVLGLRAPHQSGHWTPRHLVLLVLLPPATLSALPLPESARYLMALLALPWARYQACMLWSVILTHPRSEAIALTLTSQRELVHKLAWVTFFALNQCLLFGAQTPMLWTAAPFSFGPLMIGAFCLTGVCLAEPFLRNYGKVASNLWIWIRVQAGVAQEETLFRGLLCAVLWPLLKPLSQPTALVVASMLFALPHFERGHPRGCRGVLQTFLLGGACLLLNTQWNSTLPGLLLHGGVFASWASWRWSRAQQGNAPHHGAVLFLLRFRTAYYVTDWRAKRILRLAGSHSPLALRIEALTAGTPRPTAISIDELTSTTRRSAENRIESGMQLLRSRCHFLVIASAKGELPDERFPSMALACVRALPPTVSSR